MKLYTKVYVFPGHSVYSYTNIKMKLQLLLTRHVADNQKLNWILPCVISELYEHGTNYCR